VRLHVVAREILVGVFTGALFVAGIGLLALVVTML
jgi:hypothetical protein